MASSLSTLAKNRALDAIGTAYGFASAHSGDPGATGTANELTGGNPAYARKAISWAAANNGSKAMQATFPTFDVPPGQTVAYIGLWTLASGGEYGGCFDVTDEVFAGQGTYTLTAGSVGL
jgi:hypothetical protein